MVHNIARNTARQINPLINESPSQTLSALAGVVQDFGDLLSRHPELSNFLLCVTPAVSGALEFEAAQAREAENV